jgi:hypothetical protein
MISALFATVLLAQAAQAPDAAVGPPEPTAPAIAIQKVEGPDAEVFYPSIPWGPNTFAAMERPGEGYYNRRSWPFARLQTKIALKLDGIEIPPGNHALVFHPNTPDDAGMSLEVRRIDVPEFLEEGNVMTRTPEGETIWRAPVRFDTAAGTAPVLKVEILPEAEGFRLRVQYGDRFTSKTFLH